MPIPKIIHQIWIGDKPPPTNMMYTWKKKNPDFEYIFWNEAELVKRGIEFKSTRQINMINEINGKADIIRWEILLKYGGIFIDADSICIEPLDNIFTDIKEGFATYENETMRGKLVATGTMGFIPNHPLCKDIIDWIVSDESEESIRGFRAWFSVGPALLTRFLDTGNYPQFTVFASHYFLPIHFTGDGKYEGHKKVYGYQEWGTAKQSYDTMNSIQLPRELLTPPNESQWVSILVSSFNTKIEYIHDCLESIRMQNGYLGIELVWMNDGSDQENTLLLENELMWFQSSTRFCNIVYERIEKNVGTFECLNRGILKCSHELIYKMDADDIMMDNRLWMQYEFMNANPDIVISGGGIILFDKSGIVGHKTHKTINWDEFKQNPNDWIMNHPTVCMRKSAVMAVGNYNPFFFGNTMMEDWDLELRLLKRFGKIHNIPETLVYYRIHEDQLTKKIPSGSSGCVLLRKEILHRILDNNESLV